MDDINAFRHGIEDAGPSGGRSHPGVEVTTGPLGQGFGNAVGMAIAERLLAARSEATVVDHHTFVIAGDGCLMEGQPRGGIPGRAPRLGNLICVYDDNHITIDGRHGSRSATTAAASMHTAGMSSW